jgi:hypothetical protein
MIRSKIILMIDEIFMIDDKKLLWWKMREDEMKICVNIYFINFQIAHLY